MPLLQLSRDADAINAVVNDPAVRPFVGPASMGALDLKALIDRPENLFPFGDLGGFALLWTAPHALEVHTFILPEGRGRWARKAAREGIEMARFSGARTLWTRIPPDQPNVRIYAAMMGMRATGEVVETFGAPYTIFAMEAATCQ